MIPQFVKARTAWRLAWLLHVLCCLAPSTFGESLRLAFFEADATPPVGSPLAYDPMIGAASSLSCRGVVLLGEELPIVLCAVDWIGIANGGLDAWRRGLAEGAGTVPERVTVHTLHQHDAPICDFTADKLLAPHGLSGLLFDPVFARATIARAAQAIQTSMGQPETVTHLGVGMARVEKVASNRRILGPDGRVAHVRWTACKDPALRAEPTGTIDPMVRLISLWNEERPLVVLSYYATHPQSYYRTGLASADFPGLARSMREQTVQVPHVHFNGAGGNIGAGKWNDGAPENRLILAQRLAAGMEDAWRQTERQPVNASDLRWSVETVRLPVRDTLDREELRAVLSDAAAPAGQRGSAARNLAWLERADSGAVRLDLTCLQLGPARVVHLPGEAVVEYQLAAQQMQPDLFVATAAYGDYGAGYICLEDHYSEGGYEDSPRASRVAPAVEPVLMEAMEKLLAQEDSQR